MIPSENLTKEIDSFFSKIDDFLRTGDEKYLDDLTKLLQEHPDFINYQKNSNTPIFHILFSDANKVNKQRLFQFFYDHDPTIFDRQKKYGETLIFRAIIHNRIDDLELILKINSEFLDQTSKDFSEPIFCAITTNNINAVKLILEKDEKCFDRKKDDESPLDEAIRNYILDESSQNATKARSVLNAIYKKQFGAEQDISDEELKKMKDYHLNYCNLKLSYGAGGLRTNLDKIIKIHQLTLEQVSEPRFDILTALDNVDSKYLLTTSCDSVLGAINNYSNPVINLQERLYIAHAKLKDHATYFIFHVRDDKLTHISYCDGNDMGTKVQFHYPSYIQGARKFQLSSPIDFSKNFIDNFLEQNTKDKEALDFYEQYGRDGLRVTDPATNKTQYLQTPICCSINTRLQARGNCGYKSLKILWQYVAELSHPHLKFSRSEVADSLDKFDDGAKPIEVEDTKKKTSDQYAVFKDFKGKLSISSIKFFLQLRQSLQEESTNSKFRDFLTPKIDKILQETYKNSLSKIQKNANNPQELEIHEQIKLLTAPPLLQSSKIIDLPSDFISEPSETQESPVVESGSKQPEDPRIETLKPAIPVGIAPKTNESPLVGPGSKQPEDPRIETLHPAISVGIALAIGTGSTLAVASACGLAVMSAPVICTALGVGIVTAVVTHQIVNQINNPSSSTDPLQATSLSEPGPRFIK